MRKGKTVRRQAQDERKGRWAVALPNGDHDVIIIGSGAAGLTAAITLADHCRVLVLAKGELTGGSTAWAQGGIAAVLDAGDTFENHIEDTMVAGAGLNRRETVEFVVENAPHAIERLIEMGVAFNKEEGALHERKGGGEGKRGGVSE